MLGETSFEQISVTELCRRAETSRITFYTHYSDKYALVDEIFIDMLEIGKDNYRKRQKENNSGNSLVEGYCNMLECILEIYYERFDFFRHTDPSLNPYLASVFYNIVLETVEEHTKKIDKRLRLKYSAKKIAGFLCFGLLGFINECHSEKTPLQEIRKESKQLLTEILKSSVLVERKRGTEGM